MNKKSCQYGINSKIYHSDTKEKIALNIVGYDEHFCNKKAKWMAMVGTNLQHKKYLCNKHRISFDKILKRFCVPLSKKL